MRTIRPPGEFAVAPAAELLNPGLPDRGLMARRVLRGYDLDGAINANDLLNAAARFAAKIQELFPRKRC